VEYGRERGGSFKAADVVLEKYLLILKEHIRLPGTTSGSSRVDPMKGRVWTDNRVISSQGIMCRFSGYSAQSCKVDADRSRRASAASNINSISALRPAARKTGILSKLVDQTRRLHHQLSRAGVNNYI